MIKINTKLNENEEAPTTLAAGVNKALEKKLT